MKLARMARSYQWPAMIAGFLLMSVTAHAILVYVATRPSSPRAVEDYYQRSLRWDADAAALAASRALGWQVTIDVPSGSQYAANSLRPIDVVIQNRRGEAVAGLQGKLMAIPPGDTRMLASRLVELPHAPGHYRSLAPLRVPGDWHIQIDASVDETRFVHNEHVRIGGGGS